MWNGLTVCTDLCNIICDDDICWYSLAVIINFNFVWNFVLSSDGTGEPFIPMTVGVLENEPEKPPRVTARSRRGEWCENIPAFQITVQFSEKHGQEKARVLEKKLLF